MEEAPRIVPERRQSRSRLLQRVEISVSQVRSQPRLHGNAPVCGNSVDQTFSTGARAHKKVSLLGKGEQVQQKSMAGRGLPPAYSAVWPCGIPLLSHVAFEPAVAMVLVQTMSLPKRDKKAAGHSAGGDKDVPTDAVCCIGFSRISACFLAVALHSPPVLFWFSPARALPAPRGFPRVRRGCIQYLGPPSCFQLLQSG